MKLWLDIAKRSGWSCRSTIHEKYKIPALELVIRNLHAGGKFGKGAYQLSGGLHGVGAKCVNAFSELFDFEVRRDGYVHYMKFEKGKIVAKRKIIGESQKTGTRMTFLPDAEIFLAIREFEYEILQKGCGNWHFRIREFTSHCTMNGRQNWKFFRFDEGIRQFVSFLDRGKRFYKVIRS
jgi:DNA gyrase subunit B